MVSVNLGTGEHNVGVGICTLTQVSYESREMDGRKASRCDFTATGVLSGRCSLSGRDAACGKALLEPLDKRNCGT